MSDLARAAQRRAAALVHGLAHGGVTEAVVSPGSRNTPLVLALAEHPAIRVHVVLDERSAGFVALGLARVTGRPAVLSCTSGSAGASWFPAIVEANRAGVPLIAVTADRPAELHGVGAPQTMAQARLFGDHVRLSLDLPAPWPGEPVEWVATAAARALHAATGARPGPVHVNAAFREPLWAPGPSPPVHVRPVHVEAGRSVAPEGLVRALADRLQRAERGVVCCGHRELAGCAQPDLLGPAVARLAARLGWPVLAEPTSRLRFGRDVVRADEAIVRAAGERLAPDLVLRFGQAPTSRPVYEWAARHGRGRTILVDPHGDWNDPHHVADTLLAVDPVALCDALVERLPPDPAPTWLETWVEADRRASEVIDAACADGFWEGGIARQIARACPAGALLHVASSMPIRDLASFAPPLDHALCAVASRGTNGIDGTLSTAVGEALAWGGPVVVVSGDLAFLHDLGGLITARGRDLSVCAVVIDNGGGGIFEYLPIREHAQFEPLFLTPQGADVAALAEASGAAVTRVDGARALGAALREQIGAPGLSVVVARVDRADNVQRHRDVWAAVARALSPG